MVETAFRRRGGAVALPSDVAPALGWDKRFRLDAEEWRMLLHRCYAIARGEPVEAERRARGWKGTTFQEGWRRAATAIADGMNAERGRNRAAFQANEDAEERLLRTGKMKPAASGIQPSLVVVDAEGT